MIDFVSLEQGVAFILGFYAFPLLCVPCYYFGRLLGFFCRKAYLAVVAHFDKESK